MKHLLILAELLCGTAARRSIFEPLVADWQRELNDARGRRHGAALISGGAAFAVSLGRALVIGGSWLPTYRAAGGSLLAFFLAVKAAVLILVSLAATTNGNIDLGGMQVQFYVLSTLGLTLPAAMLPALFMLRRDPRSTTRHAIGVLALGCSLTAVLMEMTTGAKLRDYFSSFEAFERQYQRNLDNDRAGRYQYPATALRQLRGPTTIEQRRESYRRFEAWRQEQEATQAPPTWGQSVHRQQPTLLALLLGVVGWTLAGLGPPVLRRAGLWWVLMLGAMLAFNGTVASALRSPVRPPYWLVVPIVLTVTLLLVAESWRARYRRQQ